MQAELLPVAPEATAPLSSTATFVTPRLARLNVMLAPVTPAPIITTSAVCVIIPFFNFRKTDCACQPSGYLNIPFVWLPYLQTKTVFQERGGFIFHWGEAFSGNPAL